MLLTTHMMLIQAWNGFCIIHYDMYAKAAK